MKVKELGEIKKRLILLLENGKLNGFNIIKVAKLITIILFNELWAVDDALCITIFAISNDTIKLDVIRVFIEDFLSAKSLGLDHQKHIYTCLYQSAQYIIGKDCQNLFTLKISPTNLTTWLLSTHTCRFTKLVIIKLTRVIICGEVTWIVDKHLQFGSA